MMISKGKLVTAKFFAARILPRVYGLGGGIMSGAESVMASEIDWL